MCCGSAAEAGGGGERGRAAVPLPHHARPDRAGGGRYAGCRHLRAGRGGGAGHGRPRRPPLLPHRWPCLLLLRTLLRRAGGAGPALRLGLCLQVGLNSIISESYWLQLRHGGRVYRVRDRLEPPAGVRDRNSQRGAGLLRLPGLPHQQHHAVALQVETSLTGQINDGKAKSD